ncbi:MAG: phosphate ABC transporter substrate-binding protein [Mesorhizobium sp.]|nr:MAG: phosphate ABC transporter substrate-binding protein [Mesorhizobium sp.]
MSELIAALPMYDWPEARDEVDAQWASLREAFRPRGIDAPQSIVRRNADLPAVPGGIHDAQGRLIAPDPATLPPDELDFHKLWLHPALLFAQTCWGPMELGLSRHVQVVGQPSYDAYEGGRGELYSSALVMRLGEGPEVRSPADGKALLPLDLVRGKRFTFNSLDSMSGIIALTRDLEAAGENLDIFSSSGESGGHRGSIEPAARKVVIVGWTARRKGLPFITAKTTPEKTVRAMREALAGLAEQPLIQRVG